MNLLDMNLSDNISRFRKEKELTQEQLAQMLNVSVAAISKWENGNNRPDIDQLPALAEVFEVSIDALLGYEKKYKNLEKKIEEMKQLLVEEKYDLAVKEAEKLLKRYPNGYELNFFLAEAYYSMCFSGKEMHVDDEAFKQSVHYYERCMELCDERVQGEGKKEELHMQIATLYAVTEEGLEKGISIIDKYNRNGIYDTLKANCLYKAGQKEEAKRIVLKHSVGSQVFVFNDFTVLASFFEEEGDVETALTFLEAELAQFELYMKDEPSYADRAYAGMGYIISTMYAKCGKKEMEEKWLEKAKIHAKKYMENPTMKIDSLKYCEGVEGRMVDNYGPILENLCSM